MFRSSGRPVLKWSGFNEILTVKKLPPPLTFGVVICWGVCMAGESSLGGPWHGQEIDGESGELAGGVFSRLRGLC